MGRGDDEGEKEGDMPLVKGGRDTGVSTTLSESCVNTKDTGLVRTCSDHSILILITPLAQNTL